MRASKISVVSRSSQICAQTIGCDPNHDLNRPNFNAGPALLIWLLLNPQCSSPFCIMSSGVTIIARICAGIATIVSCSQQEENCNIGPSSTISIEPLLVVGVFPTELLWKFTVWQSESTVWQSESTVWQSENAFRQCLNAFRHCLNTIQTASSENLFEESRKQVSDEFSDESILLKGEKASNKVYLCSKLAPFL